MLPFKTRRTSQPQGAVEIDWGNPLTRGLVLAHLPFVGGATIAGSSKITPMQSGIAAVTNYVGGYQDITWPLAIPPISGDRTFAVFSSNQNAYELFATNTISGGESADSLAIGETQVAAQIDGNSAGVLTILKSATPRLFAGRRRGNQASIWHQGTSTSEYITGTRTITPNLLRVGRDGGSTTLGTTCYLSLLWGRYVPDDELAKINANPWQLFKPVSRSLWIPGTVSGGGAATVIPTGQQATGSVGALVATGAAKGLPAGVSASSAVGTPVAVGGASIPATVTPAGVSATGSVGMATATGQAKAHPAGVSATASVGSAVAVGQARAFPSGVSASTGVGTPVAVAGGAAIATPSGVQAVGAVGNLIATGQAWRVASGVSATGATGTPVVLAGGSAVATPEGVQSVGAVGTPEATGACTAYAVGLSGYWSVGVPIAVPGVSGVAVAHPSGVQAGGYVGVPTAKGASVAFAHGVYALGRAGVPMAGLISIIPPGHVKFIPDTAAYAFVPGATTYSFEVNT